MPPFLDFAFNVDNQLTDLTSAPSFSSPDGDYGLQETNSQDTIIPDGELWQRVNQGVYRYDLAGANLSSLVDYNYWIKYQFEGEITRLQRFIHPASVGGGGSLSGVSGGGILNGRIAYSSLTPKDYLQIIQGEEKVLTFIVEADGRFDNQIAGIITVKLKDPLDAVVTKLDSTITRITEQLDVQVFRTTLTPTDTMNLSEGLLRIEIAFDTQKAVITHTLKVLKAL